MDDRILIDTDIIIDYLKGYLKAADYLEKNNSELLLSAITVAELYAGVREEEKNSLDMFINAFDIIDINHEISIMGGLFKRDFYKSHGVGLADSLIAASAKTTKARLATLNRNHYPMLDDIIVPYKK